MGGSAMGAMMCAEDDDDDDMPAAPTGRGCGGNTAGSGGLAG
jgi:hypothetical protein